MNEQILLGFRRFAKGFLAGGLAQVALIIGPGMSFETLQDIKALATILAVGFITGGILAVEKMLSYTPHVEK